LKPIDLFTWPCPAYLYDLAIPSSLSSCAIDEYGHFRINHPFDWPRELALRTLGGTSVGCNCLHVLDLHQDRAAESAALRCRRGLPPLPDHPWPKEARPPGCRAFLIQLTSRVVEVLRKRGWDAEIDVDARSQLLSDVQIGISTVLGGERWGAKLVGGGTSNIHSSRHEGWMLNLAADHPRIVNATAAFYETQFIMGMRRRIEQRCHERERTRRLRLLSDYRDLLELRSPNSTLPPRSVPLANRPDEYRRRIVETFHDWKLCSLES
jgi:hypothetical protein